jgi:hypothetical protein
MKGVLIVADIIVFLFTETPQKTPNYIGVFVFNGFIYLRYRDLFDFFVPYF